MMALLWRMRLSNGLGISIEKVLSQIDENQKKHSQRCIIEVEGSRVGECSYRLAEDHAEIGIKICDASYQNRGLGSKILKMLIVFLFTDEIINTKMILDKIILDTNAKNLRAQHVYEKLGFRKLRINTDIWKDQLGEMQSSVDYEMTREEYQQQDYA